jgi:hypothetical protein
MQGGSKAGDNTEILKALDDLRKQLTANNEKNAVTSPTTYSPSCPTPLTECNPTEMQKYGLSCPAPVIANTKWMIATTDGKFCSLPSDVKKLMQTIPGWDGGVDSAINAISKRIVEKAANQDPQIFQNLMRDVKSKLPVIAVKDAIARAASAGFRRGLEKGETKGREVGEKAGIEIGRKYGEETYQEILEKMDKKKKQSGGDGIFGSILGGELSGGASPRRSARKSPKRKSPTPKRRSSTSHYSSQSSEPYVSPVLSPLSPRTQELKSFFDSNGLEIATFRSEDCPIEYDGRKFVKARGAYPECEKLMGFRWVSPNGRCYPEGLCNIPEGDIVQNESILSDKLVLLRQLTVVNNDLNKSEREAFINKKKQDLFNLFKKSADGKRDTTKKVDDFIKDAEKLLPYNLRILPTDMAITDINNLLALAPKDAEANFPTEVRYVKQALIDANVMADTDTEESLKTKAMSFVKTSMVCAQANVGPYEKRATKRDKPITELMVHQPVFSKDTGTVENICEMVDIGDDSFWMPKDAAKRQRDDKTSDDFDAGRDPLAIAFKFVADRYLERTKKHMIAKANAYSPVRR